MGSYTSIHTRKGNREFLLCRVRVLAELQKNHHSKDYQQGSLQLTVLNMLVSLYRNFFLCHVLFRENLF